MSEQTKVIHVITSRNDDLDMDDILDHVSNGGTLTTYCKDRCLPFGDTRAWVTRHPLRNKLYKEALMSREDYLAQSLINMIIELVRHDPGKVITDTGAIKPLSQWPPEARAAIKSFKVDPLTNQITDVQFTDRLKAIEMAGRTIGVFAKKVQVEGQESLADLVMRSLRSDNNDDPTGEAA